MPYAPRIFISAGELSGDFHGSHLVRAIKEQCPDAEFFGVGSHNMASAGVNLLYESSNWGGIGIYQNLKRAPIVHRAGKRLLKELPSMNLDLIITIDYRVFHAALLKGLRNLSVGKLYYFAPVVWPGAVQKPLGKAYSSFLRSLGSINPFLGSETKDRFKALSELADKLIVAYPFALEDYRKAGGDVEFLGHPLMNVIKANKNREQVRQQIGLKPDDKLIGIFPGSRWHEINVHLPVLADVAYRLLWNQSKNNYYFYLPIAHPDYKNRIFRMLEKILGQGTERFKFVSSDDYDVFAASDLALSKTGTSVQILMALGVPTIAFYTVVSSLWYNLTKRYFLDFEHIAFPNIIAGRTIVPEFIQDDFKSSKILNATVELLNDDEKRKKMSMELREIRDFLYRPDALERAAAIALELANRRSRINR